MKKVPIRQCLGCREHFEKRNLIRVVKNKEGEITLDFKGKLPGRGAYICNNVKCLEKSIKTRALSRAFSCQIPDEIFESLKTLMEENIVE